MFVVIVYFCLFLACPFFFKGQDFNIAMATALSLLLLPLVLSVCSKAKS